jgi:hypothetical protein
VLVGLKVTVAATRGEFRTALEADRQESRSERGRFDAVVLDMESFGQVEVYLLSLTQLIPLIMLASATERESDSVRELDLQYTPCHVMRLPLRQVRLHTR